MVEKNLTGPWHDDDDCFQLRSVAAHHDQLEPEAIIEKLKSANRSLNHLFDLWGRRKIGQGHDLYVYHIPAATMTPASRALFLHLYLDILHPSVLLGDMAPKVRFHQRDKFFIDMLMNELISHNLIAPAAEPAQLFVKDFMVGGELVMIAVEWLE